MVTVTQGEEKELPELAQVHTPTELAVAPPGSDLQTTSRVGASDPVAASNDIGTPA